MTHTPDPERKTRTIVDGLGVPYEVIPYDPEFADTAALCDRYGYPPDHAGNTIIVASKKEPRQYAACVVTATTRLDVNHAIRSLLGVSKVSFASAGEMARLTGMTVGGVTVFGRGISADGERSRPSRSRGRALKAGKQRLHD